VRTSWNVAGVCH